jgi:AraC-like DNA-binding protein
MLLLMTTRRKFGKSGIQNADRARITIGQNHFGPLALPPSLPSLFHRFRLRVTSCLWWRTAPGWSLPERRINDTLLYVPARGTAELAVRRRWRRCGPGSVAILPDGLPQAGRYAPSCRSWDVLAVHLVLDDAWHNHFAAGFADHVFPLPDHQQWVGRLARLAALLETDRQLGESHGHDLIRLLLTDLLFAGAAVRPPEAHGDPRIIATLQTIEADPGRANVAELARSTDLSPARFRQLFARATGQTPKAYVAERQLDKAINLLRTGKTSVRDIAAECGFCNDHHFHRRFKERFGETPSQWRRSLLDGP